MRIAVLGAGGQLGAAVVAACRDDHDVAPVTRSWMDLRDPVAIEQVIRLIRPDAIVNAAAWTDVDAAEDRWMDAHVVNAVAVCVLAKIARLDGIRLVHYSTDFVFDGLATAPYVESDRPNPQSVYAKTKWIGEGCVLATAEGIVLRVASLFGRASEGLPAKGSIARLRATLRAGGSPSVFIDRTSSPTYVLDAARATREILERNIPPGVYHCVNEGSCTWLELALELARQLGIEPRLTPVRFADVLLNAPRPQYAALSTAKLRAHGIVLPPWQDAIARYVRAESS